MMRPTIMVVLSVFAALVANVVAQPTERLSEPRSPTVEWVTREVKAPRVSFHTFDSAAAKGKVSYHLYTPAAYGGAAGKGFPVVYWLHGSGGGAAGIAKVAAHFDAAIEAGKTPPCLVVFVNGLVEGMYVDWKDGTAPVETVIVKDLVPHIDGAYRTIATREGRLLDGFSMGGYGAARLGFKFPEMFRAVSIVGAGPMQAELVQTPRAGRQRATEVLNKVYGGDQAYFRSVSPRTLAEQHAATLTKSSLVRLIIGDKDETFENNRLFHEHLDALKIPHTWTVLPGVEHDPMGVLRAIGDDNWAFYRAAFGQAASSSSAARKAEVVLSFKIKDQDRRAVVANASTDGTKRPTVIVLHGGMGSAEVMRANAGFDAVAKASGFTVVYAEGTDFGGGRHAWNTGYLLRRQVKDADDIAYFDTLIDTLIRDHGADPERIYMTGGSNGGMMTFVYAVARPQRLAAIAPVVASMFTFDSIPAVPAPILIINGANDEEVPLEGGMSRNPIVKRAQEAPYKPLKDVVQFWVRVNKSLAEPRTTTLGTVITTTYDAGPGGAVTEFVVDSAGGHGWPGSKSRRDGNAPIASFSGAERVWTFFERHTRKPDDLPADKPAATGLNPDVLTRLNLAMQQATANKEVAGVVGLVFRNGHRGYFEAFGKQDIEAGTPMPRDAIFRLQSMSKPVVTVAALTLLDEGRFTLDEPISKHLPEWAEPMVLENGKLVPAKSPITPRMLMSHSSGLYYGNLPGAPAGGGVTRDARTTLESYSKDLAARPLKFHPGEGYSYGTSIDVLGRYVEVVAGKPLDEVLRERLFTPLKMHDTDFWVQKEKAGRIAQLYRQVRPGELARGREASLLTSKPSLFMGGQGLCSTAEDYERFCHMIRNRGELDGVRILKPETVDLMFQNHLKLGSQRYGLGGAVDERGGYSWGGANGTQFWIDSTNNMFGIFMVQTQRYRAPTYNTFRRLVNEAAGVTARGGGLDGPLGDQPAGDDARTGDAPQPGGRLRQAFDRLDADGNGSLSQDEYIASPMADRVDFATADADGDGSVSYQEAMAVLRRR